VEEQGKPKQKAEQDIAALRALLSLAERVECTSTLSERRTDHVIRIEPEG
jgi:hypothetical protein